MSDVTQLLDAIDHGDPHAAAELLPLVYAELRRLAAARLAREQPGQTLEATALVHEAYVRLVASGGRQPPDSATSQPPDGATSQPPDDATRLPPDGVTNRGADAPRSPEFANRGHFFAAAAEAMRRILVESARRKASLKHGGEFARADLDLDRIAAPASSTDLLALDEALQELERHDEAAARLVKLRYFAGLGHGEAAAAMGVTRRAADRLWMLARAWLLAKLGEPRP